MCFKNRTLHKHFILSLQLQISIFDSEKKTIYKNKYFRNLTSFLALALSIHLSNAHPVFRIFLYFAHFIFFLWDLTHSSPYRVIPGYVFRPKSAMNKT